MIRAFTSLFVLIALMAACIFVPAGTTVFWEAWLYLAIFAFFCVAATIDLARRDPALLVRRMEGGPHAEKRPVQRIIMSLALLGFALLLVVPGLDDRYNWSLPSDAVIFAGDALVAVGFLVIMRVYRENTFAGARIEVTAEQKVIDTGPYAIVRHPMYAGGLILLVGTLLALASYWGLLVVALMVPFLVWRIIDEEQLLERELAGYREYEERVRWRLSPFVW